MTLASQVAGVAPGYRKVYRKKTYDEGTVGGYDCRNTYSQPFGAETVPAGSKLKSLVRGGNDATVSGANEGTDGGGLTINTGKKIILPSEFKIPVGRTHELIVVWLKHGTQTIASGSAVVAGWMDDIAVNANWGWYINSGAAGNYNFVGGGKSGPTVSGFTAGQIYQIALEMEVYNAGANIRFNIYRNGLFVTTTATTFSAFPQPGGNPVIGAADSGALLSQWVGEFFAIDRTDLTLDSRVAADIVAADYAAWSGRFS